jgi:hypothetical protein
MYFILFILGVDYRLCITEILHQQLCGYNAKEKLHLQDTRTKKVKYHFSRTF